MAPPESPPESWFSQRALRTVTVAQPTPLVVITSRGRRAPAASMIRSLRMNTSLAEENGTVNTIPSPTCAARRTAPGKLQSAGADVQASSAGSADVLSTVQVAAWARPAQASSRTSTQAPIHGRRQGRTVGISGLRQPGHPRRPPLELARCGGRNCHRCAARAPSPRGHAGIDAGERSAGRAVPTSPSAPPPRRRPAPLRCLQRADPRLNRLDVRS